jgi:hypothetical protein
MTMARLFALLLRLKSPRVAQLGSLMRECRVIISVKLIWQILHGWLHILMQMVLLYLLMVYDWVVEAVGSCDFCYFDESKGLY